MYDVITVGSSTVDVFADSESELIKIKSSKETEELIAYPSGSKILIRNISFLTGGGGTNTAVALSRLGHKVAYLGKLGNDINADMILRELREEKVDFIGVQEKGMSGYSVILKSLEHDRSILAYKGVNNNLGYEEIDLKKVRTKWFYFSSMVGESYTTLEKLAQFAREQKIGVVFNPSNYLAEKGTTYLNKILSRTKILILNKDEAQLLVGRGQCKDLIDKLMNCGPDHVVVTDGKNGAYTFFKGKVLHVLPSNITPFETTGAGDAFAASFLSGIIKKGDVEFALKLAQTNAESVIQFTGAKNRLLTYREALQLLKKRKIKVRKGSI
ncbi:carbohydrate kinase family protein [Candidatus Woesearchaeota archaeon]|nr:carbohydrate kinase family protein [Candidatus Woesearchaeota archaeon]